MTSDDPVPVDALDPWFRSAVPGVADGPLLVERIAGGHSNLTYRITDAAGTRWALRRPPTGMVLATAHDMGREWRFLRARAPTPVPVAEPVALCTDPSVIGAEFYVMGYVDGAVLGDEVSGHELTREARHAAGLDAVDVLAELHGIDPEAAGLGHLGKGAGYVRRQVEGWSTRYRNARTADVPDLETVMAWLDRHQPDDVATCVIHNDFKLDNLVLSTDDVTRVVGVLDWEMATLGDPLMDLGGALAYWVQADDDDMYRLSKRQPTDLPGMPTRAEVVDHYRSRTGRAVDDWPFYEVFGLFRLAGIAQQIYYRYHHGQTTNEAFKDFWFFVTYLDERCRRIAGLV